MKVSFVTKGIGVSNTGNVARNFFSNSAVAGRSLNFETNKIQLFRDLLIDMNSRTKRPDIKAFMQKSECLFGLISNNQF